MLMIIQRVETEYINIYIYIYTTRYDGTIVYSIWDNTVKTDVSKNDS